MPAKMVSADRIFKGLIRCPKCGCLYTPELKKGKYVTYACTNGKGNCKRVYVSERILLEPVYELFKAFEGISREVQERLVDELRKSNEAEIEFRNRELTRVRAEFDQTQRRIDRLTDLYLDGMSITKDEYDKKLQDLKDRQYRLNLELDEHTKADHEYHIHVSTVINLCRRIRIIFEGSEVSEKHAIINFVLSNLSVTDRKLMYSLRKPFDAVLDLALSSNLAPMSGLVLKIAKL
jgi:site-specific DNA recombinase